MLQVKTLQNWNVEKASSFTRDAAIVIGASFLIALLGQISIPLPFTPVPISFRLQTILCLSVLIGSRRSFLATFAFLMQGMLGFPLFTNGLSGIAGLVSPTGGYLIGYLAAAFIGGYIVEKKPMQKTLAFFAGSFVVYALGAGYLATFVGIQSAILLGVIPFVLGDILKSAICLKFLQKIKGI